VKKTFRRTITVLAAGTAIAGSLAAVSAAPAYANCDVPTLVGVGEARAYEGTSSHGFTTLTFPVEIAGCFAGSVDYTTTSGTGPLLGGATAGVDFTTKSGTLKWGQEDGASVQDITVNVAADSTDEPNEWFSIKLSNPTGFIQVNTSYPPHGEILDDDGPVSWNIDDATCIEGAPTLCNVTITTSKASASDMTVTLTTANGTATSPTDYLGGSKTVTVKAGARTAIGQIAVVDDGVCEGTETFKAKLTSPSTGAIADGQAVVTIVGGVCP
jgi:hypothetical protein